MKIYKTRFAADSAIILPEKAGNNKPRGAKQKPGPCLLAPVCYTIKNIFMDKRTSLPLLLLSALLLLIGAAVYANSIANGFVWDDNWLIVTNPDIKTMSIEKVRTIFTHDLAYFMEKSNFYRPLQSLSYMLDYRLWGENPAGYRATNILIHCANGILIFFLLRLFFGNIASFLGAAFFLVHPVNTSAVAYIAGRSDLLALFLLLSSFLFLVRFRTSGRYLDGALSIAAFFFSLFTKEICVTFVLFAAFLLLSDRGKTPAPRKNTAVLTFFFLLGGLYLFSRLTFLKFAPLGSQAVNVPPIYNRLLAVAPVILTYLRLIVLPYDLRMDRDLVMPSSFLDGRVLISLVLLSALCFALAVGSRRRKNLSLGIAWFFVMLLPSLNVLIPLNAPLSEHWLYVPFFGASAVLACCLSPLTDSPGKYARAITVGMIALLAVYASVTVRMNTYWKSEETLFSYIARFKTVHPRVHYNLGQQYLKKGEYPAAIAEFEKSANAQPDNFEAVFYTGVAHARLKNTEKAMLYFAKASKMRPDFIDAYIVFGQELGKAGAHEKAMLIYKTALKLDANNIAAYNGMAIACAEAGDLDGARSAWQRALEIDPSSAEVRANLARLDGLSRNAIQMRIDKGNNFAAMKEYRLAIVEYEKALEMDNRNVTLYNNLGVLYGMSGDNERAAAAFRKAAELSPGDAGVHKNLGIIYSNMPGKEKEAVRHLNEYLRLDPAAEDRDIIIRKIQQLKEARVETP